MAGRTARRSGLESAGVVVEMYKNLTDRAGSYCFIGQIALRLMPNTAPHICGPCYNCLSYPLFQLYLIIENLRSSIKPFPNIPFSVHLSFQTENIPHSHPGFLPDAPRLPLQVLFLPYYVLLPPAYGVQTISDHKFPAAK